MVCSVCGVAGHNKRTCSKRFQLIPVVPDEPPMETDLELTPTPRSEVDVATEGYTGILLDNDVLGLVGEQVLAIRDKITRSYWFQIQLEGRSLQFDNLNLTELVFARNTLFKPSTHRRQFSEAPWETIQDCRQDRRTEWLGQVPYSVPRVSWVQYVVDEIGSECPQVGFGKGRDWTWKKTKCGKCGVFGHTARSRRFHPSKKVSDGWNGTYPNKW